MSVSMIVTIWNAPSRYAERSKNMRSGDEFAENKGECRRGSVTPAFVHGGKRTNTATQFTDISARVSCCAAHCRMHGG